MALALAAAPLGVRDWRMLDAYPAQYVARRLAPSESIAVDGRLDDDAWTTTPWTEGMVDITRHTDEQRDAVPADLQTRVKIRWDTDYFYVGAELRENYVDAVLACAACWRRRLGGAAACCPGLLGLARRTKSGQLSCTAPNGRLRCCRESQSKHLCCASTQSL